MTVLDGRPDQSVEPARPSGAQRRSRLAPSLRRQLWWLTPTGVITLVVPISLLVAVQIPDNDYRLFYKAPRVIDADQAWLFLAGAALLVLGSLVPIALRAPRPRRDWPRLPGAQLHVLRRAEPIAFWLTVTGYLLFAVIGAARGATPGLLISSLTSQDNYTGALKTTFAPVAGVTSLTQVGVAYVVVAGTLLCQGRSNRLIRRVLIVLVLGLLRSYFLTERLALLELIVPLVVIAAAGARMRMRRTGWLSFAPLLALPVLVVVFGAFEYSRSWVFYRQQTTQSFPLFVINRLAGYYATAYNNGALQLDHETLAGRLPYNSIQAFWTAPGVAQLDLYHRLTGGYGEDLLNTTLAQYGNPEFNNPGGLAVPIIDFGPVGGLVFFLVVGVVVGFAYRSWREGNPVGLLAYPIIFTGLLELPRYFYMTQGRVFPAAVFLLIVAWCMHRAARPRRRRDELPESVAT